MPQLASARMEARAVPPELQRVDRPVVVVDVSFARAMRDRDRIPASFLKGIDGLRLTATMTGPSAPSRSARPRGGPGMSFRT
ncbi:hypothetical protein [Paracoccus sp. IB05]|uniref:hypothetical protein n=1 Tax=Paracoccus sp. IB05 TaxID=2779367 RepID=UPI0018E8ED8A|nr:hypothetical protein [Paracoccus sp. IB05]MBJ2153041.1 hypothetical protein [Paracoccus sp. IB05]